MSKNVLVVAAHPDDEVLGCGGTVARHVQAGDSVEVVIFAEGITSRDPERDRERRREELSALQQAARAANAILGIEDVTLLDFPDNRMDTVALLDVVKTVEGIIERHRPDILYTHHGGDVNVDHRCLYDAVTTACRPMPQRHTVSTVLNFETASSTEWQMSARPPFVPNWFVDVSATLEMKRQALEAYSSEMRQWPHARSIEAVTHLARWRGANIGVEAAEAFMLGRRIIK